MLKKKQASADAAPIKKARIKDRQLDLKYRPWRFEDIVGHTQAVTEFKKIIKNRDNTLPGCIGLWGESGRGKTTFARMLATYLNCDKGSACGECESCVLMEAGNHPDYKEQDCTTIGTDEVDGVINMANFRPRFKVRVILLDEIHKIKSAAATNKLLKPLEEPPLNTMWILATNLPDSIPNSKAIIGRCLSVYLGAPRPEDISKRLLEIAKLEKVKWITSSMTDTLAQNCNAQVRNSVKSLERLINSEEELFTDRKALRTGKPSQKALDAILSEITSAGVGEDAEVNELASTLLLGLYCSDPAAVLVSIMSSKDQVKLVNSMMYLNQYLMAAQFTKSCPGIWHSDTNKRFAAAVAKNIKGGVPASEVGVIHKALVDLRIAVVSGGVDATQHMLAGCMSLMLPAE